MPNKIDLKILPFIEFFYILEQTDVLLYDHLRGVRRLKLSL